MTKTPKLFGFTQLEFAGALPVADGRYVVRDDVGERVLVLETVDTSAPARRRRRRSREAEGSNAPATLPLARVTAVRAFQPFAEEGEARRWLEGVVASEESVDRVVAEGIGLLNRALHAHAVASGDPHAPSLATRSTAARLGYGSGEQLADGAFSAAYEIDPGAATSRRQRRADELRPQERIAAVLGGRERIDACETLLLRARTDLDADRDREAALQLRVGLEALLIELRDAVADPGHVEDMATLEARRQEAGEAANIALRGDLDSENETRVRELIELCERVLRRRRVLRG